MAICKEDILLSLISSEDKDRIPSDITSKLDSVLSLKLDDLITSKALLETARDNAEQSLIEYKEKFSVLESDHNSIIDQLATITSSHTDQQTQLTANLTELATVRQHSTELESEAAKLRHERHLAADERDAAVAMVARRDGELSRLQQDVQLLRTQLHTEVEARCGAQAQLGEWQSDKLQIEYKEKRVKKERELFNTQVEALEKQLSARTQELITMRQETSGRYVILESHLATLQDEHRLLQQSHQQLQQEHAEHVERYAATQKEHCDVAQTMRLEKDAFQLELDAQRKLTDLYRVDSEAKAAHVLELEQALEEAKVRLDEAVERFGDLETSAKAERLVSEEMLGKKAVCIALLRKELEVANDLLATNGKVDDMFPQASRTSRLLNSSSNDVAAGGSSMSLTQIYNQYVRASEQAVEEREEADRLRAYIRNMMDELKEKGPLLARQRDDLERAIATVEHLTQTQDELTHDIEQLRSQTLEHKRRADREANECERMRVQLSDLGRQVCKLLQQRDLLTTSDDTAVSDAQDIISKRLVTFSSIAELQQNNQRLLAVVRELTAKQEQQEHTEHPHQVDQLSEQLERLREAHSDLLQQQQRQHKLTKMLTGQRDTYKTLYQQAVKGDQPTTAMTLERPYDPMQLDMDGGSIDGDDSHTTDNTQHSKIATVAATAGELQQVKERVQQLETDITKAHKQVEQLTNENDTYRKEKTANEKILIEVNERLRQETQQLSTSNTKLAATLDTTQLHLQAAKRNQELLRKQLDQLEERNRIHSQAQAKLEMTLQHHQTASYEAITKLSKAEVLLANAQREVAVLKDIKERLDKERDIFRTECQSMKLLHTNMALIKATLERTDAESRIRLEEALAEAQRECAALRRRLQEEQDRFRSLSADLEAKANAARKCMEEERAAADRLRADLAQARDHLQAKTAHIHDLTTNMHKSIAADGAVVDGRKYREMEQLLRGRECEFDALRQKLDVAKAALEQHTNVAEEATQQLTAVSEQHAVYRADTDLQLDQQRAKIAALEEKCTDLDAELSLHRTDHMDEQTAAEGQVSRLQQRLNVALEQLKDMQSAAAAHNTELQESRKMTEEMSDKYSREVALHSDDLNNVRVLKTTLDTAEIELRGLKQERSKLLDEQVEKENGRKTTDELMRKEKVELQRRFDDLIAQNMLLHEQIQQMNVNLSVLQVQTDQLNNSTSAGNVSLNRSLNEDEVKSSDQLLKIIKYLRQEKDVALSKAEIIESEQTRMRLEVEVAHRQLAEARAALNDERHKSETSLVANAKYAEVLRKVETMNAITDSNRTLRLERDGLLQQMKELRTENGKLSEELAPLQERLAELQCRTEALQSENTTLRGEATRWRQRANTLIEKTNRTSPEDWKKLQTERETLAKQLTIERANIVRLNDDLATLHRDKSKLEEIVKTLRITCTQQKEDCARVSEELVVVRAELQTVRDDMQQLRTEHTKLNADHITLGKDVGSKDTLVADLRSQLAQVRKIAKKYKVQFEELTKTAEEQDAKTAEAAAAAATDTAERIARLEEETRTQQETNAANIAALTAKNESSLLELEKITQQMQVSKERFAVLIKNAKDRIVELTQAKNKAEKELSKQLVKDGNPAAAAGPSGDNNTNTNSSNNEETSLDVSGNELAAKLERVEQEKDCVVAEQTLERERHTREVDELKERLSQLQRLLEDSASGNTAQQTDSRTVGVATELQQQQQPTVAVAPPTANIKPMAGHMTSHMHVASIRPHRTIPPSTTTPSTLAVQPQQVQVHTTAPAPTVTSAAPEQNSSSPTSTEQQQQQQQQQQLPTIRVLPLIVDSAGTTASAASTSTVAVVGVVSATTSITTLQQQQQTAAGSTTISVPATASTTSSSSSSSSPAAAGSSSSGTVTTSGVKRMRDNDSDSTTTTTTMAAASVQQTASASTSAGKVQAQVQPQVKRSRLITTRPTPPPQQQQQQGQLHMQQQQVDASDDVSAASGAIADTAADQAQVDADAAAAGDVEYQVPTSSQRDHDDDVEEDMEEEDVECDDMQVIDLVGSDDDDVDGDNAEAAAAEAADDEEEDAVDEDDDEEESEDDDDDDNDQGHNRIKRKRRRMEQLQVDEMEDEEEAMDEEQDEEGEVDTAVVTADDEDDEGDEAAAAEEDNDDDVVENMANVGQSGQQQQMEATSSTSRQQQVAPMAMSLRHQQQLQLLQPDESTDDGIVPSTPTLFVQRPRIGADGVSSPHPHVPTVTQGHLRAFTFSTIEREHSGGEQEVQQQQQHTATPAADTAGTAADDDGGETGRSVPSTPTHLPPPPSSAATTAQDTAADNRASEQQVEGSEEAIVAAAPNTEDEGREAEATPAPGGQQRSASSGAGAVGPTGIPRAIPTIGGQRRTSARPVSSSSSQQGGSGGGAVAPTPIVWHQQQHMAPSRSSPRHSDMMARGRGIPMQRARRSRGAIPPRGGYARY